jgi:hypothetical protein
MDNEIQKITNDMLYNRVVKWIGALFDPETDQSSVGAALDRYVCTFRDMHSTAQTQAIESLRRLFYAMLIDRVRRLMRDPTFVAVMARHHAGRLDFLRQCLQRECSGAPIEESRIDMTAYTVTVIVTGLAMQHNFGGTECERFVHLYRLLAEDCLARQWKIQFMRDF